MSLRTRCFVEMLIVILAVAAPALAQIEVRGSLSGCNQKETLPDYQDELESSRHSSLAIYCMAESLLQRHEYQVSVNALREALRGDADPNGSKSGASSKMGKVFDITRQRERAIAQYQLAIQTGDNTDGAVDEARELLEHPFEGP